MRHLLTLKLFQTQIIIIFLCSHGFKSTMNKDQMFYRPNPMSS